MGKETQQFASKFFSVDAIRCYWLMLLEEYAKAQRFVPGKRTNKPPTSMVEAKTYVERIRKIEAARESRRKEGGYKEQQPGPVGLINPDPDWEY